MLSGSCPAAGASPASCTGSGGGHVASTEFCHHDQLLNLDHTFFGHTESKMPFSEEHLELMWAIWQLQFVVAIVGLVIFYLYGPHSTNGEKDTFAGQLFAR